jgi:hypothetical protein
MNIKDIIAQRNSKTDPAIATMMTFFNRNFKEEMQTAVDEAKAEVEKTLELYKQNAFSKAEKLFEQRHDKLVSDVNDYFPEFRAILDEELSKGLSEVQNKIQNSISNCESKMEECAKRVEAMKPPRGEKGEKGDIGISGKNGSPDTPNQVVDKINTADKKVNISSVSGLPDELVNLRTAIIKSSTKKCGSGGGYWKEKNDVITPSSSTASTVVNSHESTGLVAQVSNTMWGAIGDRPATAPIGTKYYVLP